MRLLSRVTLCSFIAFFGRSVQASDDYEFHHENVMGTALELRVSARNPEAAYRAEARVLAEIDRLSRIFSSYDPASEFRRWESASHVKTRVSDELFEVLQLCDRWREFSAGAFDPRAEVCSRLWARCTRLERLPTAEEFAEIRVQASQPAWRLNPIAQTAERLSDLPLTLNAIAKGYIIERACSAGLGEGREVQGLLLNVGGDLRASGELPRTIGIANPDDDSESSAPFTTIEVKNQAAATSGSRHRGFRIQNRWYSHIIDPRTGSSANMISSATVIAARSADADALATAFNILDPSDSIRLANSLPGVACLIVGADGRIARNARWNEYEKKPFLALADEPFKKAVEKPSWGDTFELAVDFEINRPEAEPGRYRRPYVAVWIEDKEGFPVRNLALWVSQTGAGPFQWVPDLRRWFRSDKVRKKTDKREMVLTISRPTRPPGKYNLIWDGKDDNEKPLPPGEYTLLIDAAREHGTYQGIRKTVTIGKEPFAESLTGNVEIKSAEMTFRKKGPAKRD